MRGIVRVERLFDISDDDCIKEGVSFISHPPLQDKEFFDYQMKEFIYETPQPSYFSLFRFANNYPKKKEIQNLWVWVYDYVLCDKEGNEL